MISGPPLSGKGALGHYLHEYLPGSVHVSQTDPLVAGLRDEDPEPLDALCAKIRAQLRCGRKVVFSARLGTRQRRRVLDVARHAGAQRLLVELRGTDPARVQQAAQITDTIGQLQDMLVKLHGQLERYKAQHAPSSRTTTVAVSAQQPVEEQVKAVLDGWKTMGMPS